MSDPSVKQEKSDAVANPSDGQDQARRRARTPKKKSPNQHNEVRKDVVARIQSLRSAAKETSRSHLSNLERGILEIIDAVDGVGTEGKRGLKTDTLEELADVLESLSLKPEKGRRKDLKRIELAIEEMLRVVSKSKA